MKSSLRRNFGKGVKTGSSIRKEPAFYGSSKFRPKLRQRDKPYDKWKPPQGKGRNPVGKDGKKKVLRCTNCDSINFWRACPDKDFTAKSETQAETQI